MVERTEPLRLFTVFHGNLDFSALPDRDLPLVIARCYWPLLTIAEQYTLPLGIEMPARTLHRLASEDPEWLKTFRMLSERGLVEAIASGWSQVVSPLAPVDVNRANLDLGRAAYEELLGEVPTTWFVHEQTFARGLTDLYVEVGADTLIMEWNNPATHRPELRPLRYRPVRLQSSGSETLRLLWNDSVFFQKFQRAVQGVCPRSDLFDSVAEVREKPGAQALCVYGGDIEIFDYRPSHDWPSGAEEGVEMDRVGACLRGLAAEPDHAFQLPRDIAADNPSGPIVELASAADPVPCKKQPRYNPTRWAVSGRDGLGMNTQCFALRRELRALAHLAHLPTDAGWDAQRALVELWGSDYRTRATEERVRDFQSGMGAARERTRVALEAAIPALGAGEDLVLVNASDQPWVREPVQVELRFPPGRQPDEHVVATSVEIGRRSPTSPACQLEVSSRHRDGSVRSALLILEPEIEPRGRLSLRLRAGKREGIDRRRETTGCMLRTGEVEVRFLLHRGGAIAELSFPRVGPYPLAGTIPHGSFDSIAYTPDFYTGHVVAVAETSEKTTDLTRVSKFELSENGSVCSTAVYRTKTALGEWTKIYRAYHHHARLDIVHELRFREARVRSLRLGTLTVLPDAFDRETLGYSTVNGGAVPEHFRLMRGQEIGQHRAPSPQVSASSCLGATEGWVSVGDARSGIAVIADRSLAAAVPMLEFADVDDRFFLRIHHSVAETDETRATFFRGVLRVGFSVVGHRDEISTVRRIAGAIERGLAYRTESGCGIASSI